MFRSSLCPFLRFLSTLCSVSDFCSWICSTGSSRIFSQLFSPLVSSFFLSSRPFHLVIFMLRTILSWLFFLQFSALACFPCSPHHHMVSTCKVLYVRVLKDLGVAQVSESPQCLAYPCFHVSERASTSSTHMEVSCGQWRHLACQLTAWTPLNWIRHGPGLGEDPVPGISQWGWNEAMILARKRPRMHSGS